MASIKTRILVISDTHAARPHAAPAPDEFDAADLVRVVTGYRDPLPPADLVLHCGDLTRRSSVPEYETTFSVLRSLDAPLKLVIAGNHDLSLDPACDSPESRAVRAVARDAQRDGVEYLTEGTYDFALENGASVSVYASQYTPAYGGWAFQYPGRHEFAIPPGVDVAMTHGPPYGVLDEAGLSGALGHPPHHAGCGHLFEAVARARPRIHCFGHIHEGWGAYRGTWLHRDAPGSAASRPTEECVMDGAASGPIQTLDGLRPMCAADNRGRSAEARQRLAHLSNQRGCYIDWTYEKAHVDPGRQTLFLNASVMDIRYRPSQLPWIVDLDLPSAENKHRRHRTSEHATLETMQNLQNTKSHHV
ncbi:ser/Thr protein phosphatase family protein [Metarhizium album ARSEF 1941]|uniref:Ser/Thr protein phosphatase family protein n=1 Tax=Metarhizium album (strain ARSEF 1941) TaxID=1081103 RepID=A0A0B2WKB2_METAS|nr:ser/Thr protein phosphatase family protein [Metarhizium album ARSEF 1941]KHN96496.1 ser/Thr protein phosphatase family protein [Metarhizium album ARSEF 1941]